MRTEIDATNQRFLEEIARGDATAAATAYAQGAILLPPTGEIIRGRKAIESFWRSGIEIGVRTDLEAVERADADRFIYEVGRYRMLFQRAHDEPKLERGAYLLLHRQEPDGSWLRAVDIFNATSSRPRSEHVTAEGGSKP